MESENTVGTEQTPEQAAPGIEHLGQLLQEDEPGTQVPDDDAGGSHKAAPSKFNDLADTLGMELQDLYKLEVSQAEDGSPVTIENLKDYYARQEDTTLRELEFEERRTQQESELLQAQEELRELMSALPEKAIRPEVLEKVRAKHAAQLQLERKRTLEVIPDWQDEKRRTADIQGMAEHLQQYGYPVNHLERIADHRQIKYIRDNWQRELRIRKALEAVKAGKPNPTTRQKPASKSAMKKPLTGVERGNSRNKLEAVFSNLD